MSQALPEKIEVFRSQHPEVWDAFAALAGACHEQGGPLEERARRLVKLGLAVGAQHEGAVHSAARHAREAGCTPEELRHVAILAITTLGWPSAYAALRWIGDADRP
ncbi:MAG: carboxymuconolactone decarboxylase family protein [Bryobacteraceae bacterium]|nr:carboxymuconolactone decarboxylase family protein [Solibacteraceae bacterium]MCL4843934.1 carboxymuconolactone decarboxylase family protein [Bryobacteraceae bacterium]MCO5349345.1 carboxymuconolactone decarboxylase family protein [Bryobacteraceae bacterium]